MADAVQASVEREEHTQQLNREGRRKRSGVFPLLAPKKIE
jgi:hypothetical protein